MDDNLSRYDEENESGTGNANNNSNGGKAELPDSRFAILSDHIKVRTEIPYKMGDPLNVHVEVPAMKLCLEGILNAPICVADGLKLHYGINFPRVWNHVHKAFLDVQIIKGEITYMADLIRSIDDVAWQIDQQFRKLEDVRYFVPNEFTVSLKAVEGFSVRLAASRGNAWGDIGTGISDEFGIAVLKGRTAELTLELNAGVEYQPAEVHVNWGLNVPKPSLYLALPVPQPPLNPQLYSENAPTTADGTASAENGENLTFADRVRSLVDTVNKTTEDGNIQGGNIQLPKLKTNAKTHTELLADGVNENRVSVLINGIVFDTNPHHLQHFLNIIANLSAFVNHTLTSVEKQQIDLRRRALAYSIVEDGRVPTFEECVLLGTEGGISIPTASYNAGNSAPEPMAMDEVTNINLEINGGVLILHNLPSAIASFTGHPSQVCSIDIGHVCFALTGNHKEVVSRFAPVPKSAVFKVYAGQPRELRTNVFRRAQNKPLKDNNLHRYPFVAISEFLLTRQVLLNKMLGAYYSILDVAIGKVSGCIQEVAVLALAGFGKGIVVRPPYEEAPVIESLVGVQTVQIRIGRTDVLVLCGSQALTIEESNRRTSSIDTLPIKGQIKSGKAARVLVGFLPSQVASIAQLKLRDGMRFCLSNVSTNEYLTRTCATIPDLSVQLFTPWGGTSTKWVDEPTLRAQVSHSSAIKAWRQVGIQQGRPVMHKAGVFENFVLRVTWESHPSLWSDTVHILQRSRLEGADRYTRNVPQLWEASPKLDTREELKRSKSSVLDSYNAKWWVFLDLVGRRERSSIGHEKGTSLTSVRRDVVSAFVLSHMTLSIGPEALELANYIAANIRNAGDEKPHTPDGGDGNDNENRKDYCTPGDLIELWRDLGSLRSKKEDNVRTRDEDRPSRVLGTTVNCNLHVKGASVYLICPYLTEDTMDRRNSNGNRSQPVVVRDERVNTSFPEGFQLSYRWRSQRGAMGVPSPVTISSGANPTSPTYSSSLRQSAYMQIPSIVLETSHKKVATVADIHCRISDSITYMRKRRIGVDVSEETNRGNHRTFNFSVSSLRFGLPSSDFETYSELGRVFSIYGLMLRAVSLDLESTFKWYQDRRDAACDAVFAIPFSVLSELSADEIQCICFGRQARFLKSDRYIPKFESSHLVENNFLATEELEGKLALAGSQSNFYPPGSGNGNRTSSVSEFDGNGATSRSVAITAGIDEILVAVAEREALSVRKFEGEGQFEVVQDSRFAVQEPPIVRIGISSVNFSLRDDVADLGMRSVASVASYIRFAAAYIPMLSYEVLPNGSSDHTPRSISPHSSTGIARAGTSSNNSVPVTEADMDMDDISEAPKRRYKRSSTRFMLRRHVPEDGGQGNRGSRSRRRKQSIEDSPRGLTPVQSPLGLGTIDSAAYEKRQTTTSNIPGTPRRSRRRNSVENTSTTGTFHTPKNSPKLEPLSSSHELRPSPKQPIQNPNRLKDVIEIYKPTRGEEIASSRRKKGFVVRNVDRTSDANEEDRDESLERVHVSQNRTSSSRRVRYSASRNRSRSAGRRGSERGTLERNGMQQNGNNLSSSAAATIFLSIRDVKVSYFRSETQFLLADEPITTPDLAFEVSKVRSSAVITPLSLCQSVVVTVDDAKIRSGNTPKCVLESSVQKIVTMISISSGTLPSDPKRVVVSTRVSELLLSLRAADLRSVLAFGEKFQKDLTSLALSSLSTRKSLAAMMRATKLENLTSTSNSRPAFATIAGDVSIEKIQAALLGFHPGDKDMQISYEIDSIFGSAAAMEDSSVVFSLGGLVYGHGLVLSSPSWPSSERFDFPTLDIRGVQWDYKTKKPTQLHIITGPLNTSTSFQGLRNVLFTVSGLLAFQTRATFDADIPEDSLSSSPVPPVSNQRNDALSARSMSNRTRIRSGQSSATLSRWLVSWERTSLVRMEFSMRPMSVGLVSGGVMAAFETESISGVVEWNKGVTSGKQIQAVTQIPLISLKYSAVDQSTRSPPDEILAENSSLLVATQDIRLDLLKSQEALAHKFVFRLKVGSINGHLRPWRFTADAGVWANEQDVVVKEFQAVNSDAALLSRSTSRGASAFVSSIEEQMEHRVITVGADISAFSLAVPLIDEEDAERHRFRITATDVRFSLRLANELALMSQCNLALVKCQFFGVLWEDSPFVSTQEFEVLCAFSGSTPGARAHLGSIKGRCSTKTWVVCPRKDIILAFIDAKGAPENRHVVFPSTGQNTHSPMSPLAPLGPVRIRSNASNSSLQTEDRWQLFESVEFMLLPSRGYIRGLNNMQHFGGKAGSFLDRNNNNTESNASSSGAELSIPTFSVAWVRNPQFSFDLLDVDFSGKDDEFPQGILRRTGNIFSELFGAIATDTPAADQSAGDLPGFANRPRQTKREIARDWSALFRFGKSRYVARETLTGKLSTRLEFYAESHAGFLASVASHPVDLVGITDNCTVVTGVAPLLSLKIKPDLEKAMTQGLELTCLRFMQGYAPSSAPHTCVHLQGVHASMDVLTILLVREWFRKDKSLSMATRNGNKDTDNSSEGSSREHNKNSSLSSSKSLIVLGQAAGKARQKTAPRKSADAAVRIKLELSQPGGRVGLLIQRIHVGLAIQKLRNIGYSTDVHVGVHQIESRADWEHLSCSFKLSRFLFRFEGERGMQEENICGFAGILNLCTFDFKRGGADALQLKIEGVAGACRVPDCDLAVQTTIVDASVYSSSANSIQRLLQLSTRLGREAKRQIESIAISDARFHDLNYGIGGIPPLDGLPRSIKSGRMRKSQMRSREELVGKQRTFANSTASLSGERLVINLHGYGSRDASAAQIKLLAYDLDYKEQTGASYSSRNSTDGPDNNGNNNIRTILKRRQLKATFKALDVCHLPPGNASAHSVISMPDPKLDFVVQERGNLIVLDFYTKFDKEIVISSMVSHYDYLVNILKMYGESRVQVKHMIDQLDDSNSNNNNVALRSVGEDEMGQGEGDDDGGESDDGVGKRFGGRKVELKRLVFAPRLEPLGELTPDVSSILERFKLGKKEEIPGYLYNFGMIPVAKALESVTKPLM